VDGIREEFCTSQARSFYGATKLASEIMIRQYVESYGLEALINRCGAIAGFIEKWLSKGHYYRKIQQPLAEGEEHNPSTVKANSSSSGLRR
jgi:nucleoside-diphosphate-sugar epimerase